MGNRISEFDTAKGLCIVLVVVGHYNPPFAPAWWSALNNAIYAFHMPLFLFISGFLYAAFKRNCSYGRLLADKAVRLLLPYLLVSLLLIASKGGMQEVAAVDHPVGHTAWIELLWRPSAGYFLWFLWSLWWMFCLVGLCRSKGMRLLLFGLFLGLRLLHPSLPDFFCLNETAAMGVFFMLGVVCADFRLQLRPLLQTPFPLLVGLFLIAEAVAISSDVYSVSMSVQTAVALVGIATVLLLAHRLELSNLSLSQSQPARCSFCIYLFHTSFEAVTKAVVHKLPMVHSHDAAFVTGALLVIGCGTVGPILFERFVLAKFRFTRWVFGIKTPTPLTQ